MNMNKFFTSSIGRLRALAFAEGVSLIILVFVGVPFKYAMEMDELVKILGPIHGGLFILFLLNAISVSVSEKWKWTTTGKAVIASFIPFGTFYIDRKVLLPIHTRQLAAK
jgi:integral membrane protein